MAKRLPMELLIKARASIVILIASQIFFINGTTQVLKHLSLDETIQQVRAAYPLTIQKELIRQTAILSVNNLNKGYLPKLSLNGQATYQSAVSFIDVPIPGFKLEPLNKDQYRITAEINQVIYDGGTIKYQQERQLLNKALEDQKVEVELHQLKQQITWIYLDILFLDEKLKALELVKKDISIGLGTVEAQVRNGMALRSSLNSLKAEILKAEQNSIELKANRKGLVDVLSIFLGKPLSDSVVLQMPDEVVMLKAPIKRPEIQLFQHQQKLVHEERKSINIINRPKTYAFVQAGYGRPGLNFFNNSFVPFYIGGIRINWSLEGLYTSSKQRQLLDIAERSIQLQKELFMLNTGSKLQQQYAEIEKLRQMIVVDEELVALRVLIKQTAKAQLENNVLSSNDYIREIIAEDTARQNLSLHQLQLVQAHLQLANTRGE